MKQVIGVLGVGFVGSAVSRYFRSAGHDVVEYDPPKGIGLTADLERADVYFVCVPTPFTRERGFDDGYVIAAAKSIPGEGKLVAVKSTVVPGTTRRVQLEVPQHRIMFNPEFLRERCAYDDFINPERQVVGCRAEDYDAARGLLQILPVSGSQTITGIREAEMVKYFSNCYLSMRVAFANQIYDLCEAAGISYEAVKTIAVDDSRIGPGYLDVATDGYRGYGGTCFPKDMRALIQYARAQDAPLEVLEACEVVNNKLLRAGGRAEWLPPEEK